MGIGNTASASALACALLGLSPEEAVGPGAGLSSDGMRVKLDAVTRALTLHQNTLGDPVSALAALGGFEIATMTGFLLGSAAVRRPVVIDGFITTAAALVARALEPRVMQYMLFAHCSAEKAHRRMLAALDAAPLLDLGMRLGEGTGAALAIGLLRQALALYDGMATFAEAAVAGEKSA
jgi:nicotinate-nucleotide--dimethylbenzimidazole phosphoribosyltransferase